MTCRRICRELLWLARFGEFGPSSGPHLDHLASCRSCRDEVGFDRALVRQLRTALATRVADADPSPRAWEGVLARMGQPEPRPSRLREWSTVLVARLRVASAMAGGSLAIVLALNFQIVPVLPSAVIDGGITASTPARASVDGFRLGANVPPSDRPPAEEDPADASSSVSSFPELRVEQLPAAALLVASNGADGDLEPDPGTTGPEPATERQPIVFRLVPVDAAVVAGPAVTQVDEEPSTEPAPPPVAPLSSEPS